MLQRKGGPAPSGAPADIPGLDWPAIGTGPGALRFSEGDRVMGIVGGGGHAQLAADAAAPLMPGPAVAAGRRLEGLHDHHDAGISAQGGLRPGERLLVHGAAGGVGTAARRRGRRARDRERNPDARAAVQELGADAAHGPLEGFAGYTWSPKIGARTCRTTSRRWTPPAHRRHRRRRGFKAKVDLLALMGKRGTLRVPGRSKNRH